MARIVAFDALFFLLPFIAYALWLLSTRGTALRGSDWPARVLAVLSLAGIGLMAVGLFAVIHFSTAPPGQGYRPAEIRDGQLVPGEFR